MFWRSPLLCMVLSASVALPVHAGWLDNVADSLGGQKTEILPVAQGGGDDAPGVIPFTTFEAERQQVMEKLPCKWLSMAGGDGEARYDFLCKGGTWASVSLMLDKSARDPSGIGRVRLLYREWPEAVHPGGGEAYVAQQFLQHVGDHFIPANVVKEIQEAYWGRRDRTWRVWQNLAVSYTYEDKGQFVIRRLEILGRGKALEVRGPAPAATPNEAGLGKAEVPPQPAQQPRAVAPTVPAPAKPVAPVKDSVFQPLPVFTPKGVSLTVPSPTAPVIVPLPGTLQDARPEDISRQAEPSSLVRPQPPMPVSDSLVPDARGVINGRAKAPSSFDAYNKAEEMTRDVEAKAVEEARKESKVRAAVSGTVPSPAVPDVRKPAPPAKPGEQLNAVPTPQAATEESEPLETPKGPENWPQGEGLGSPSSAPVDPALLNPNAPVPGDPRFAPTRNLPQLQYIPKAQPLGRADEIIQFEDEKSGL